MSRMGRGESSLLDISALVNVPEKKKKSRIQNMMEQTATSQQAKNGKYNRILAGLHQVEEEKHFGKTEIEN